MFDTNSAEIYDFAHLGRHYSSFGGFSFEHISTVKHHHLDFYEIILIIEGELLHVHNNTTTSLSKGALLLFKPGATHQLFTEPNTSTHFVLCVEQSYFKKRAAALFPNFQLDSFDKFLSKSISKNKATYIESLGVILARDYKSNIALADEILYLCLSDFASSNLERDCEYYIDDIIRKLDRFQYMNVSAQEIYSQYPYSESILLREFKKRTGMTIVEYRTLQKMKYACQLLTETTTHVQGIALALNYISPSYFVRAFRKVYGITPSEYRKLHQKKQ